MSYDVIFGIVNPLSWYPSVHARQNRIRMDQAEWTGRCWMCQWKVSKVVVENCDLVKAIGPFFLHVFVSQSLHVFTVCLRVFYNSSSFFACFHRIIFCVHKIWRPLLPVASTAWSGTSSELRCGQNSVTWRRENGSVGTEKLFDTERLDILCSVWFVLLCSFCVLPFSAHFLRLHWHWLKGAEKTTPQSSMWNRAV